MDRETYAQMVDYIENWWGATKLWDGAARLYSGFEPVDPDAAFEVLMSRQSDANLAQYPPSPAVLRAEALTRMRTAATPAVPSTTEDYDWATHSRRTYGEVITLREAVERRHAELYPRGCQDEACDLHPVGAPP